MSSQPVPPASAALPDQPLTREEGWDLIFSLFGSAKESYAQVGGSEAWMRSERAAWNGKDSAL
jgi:hypothetical protein